VSDATGDASEPDLDLDARSLRAWVEVADMSDPDSNDAVLIISDGDVTVRVMTGLGGSSRLARFGAERLSIAAEQFAAALASSRGRARAEPVHGPLNGP
jgi:hypothetical protein